MLANPFSESISQEIEEKQKLLDLFSFGFDHWLVQKNADEEILA